MIRTKKYYTGDYLELEIYNVSPRKRIIKRAEKRHESSPAQKNLNSKRSQRYFVRLCNLNFKEGDFSIDLTYDDAHLPYNREQVLKDITNYVARVRREMKKRSSAPVKYVYVISNHAGDDTGSKARPHIHMIFGNVDRDVIEDKWKAGFSNSDKLKFDEYGITGKALYMARQGKSKRCWGSSINLEKPDPIVSDKAITKSQMERIINDPSDGLYISKLINKNNKTRYTFTDCLVEHDGRQLALFGQDEENGGNGSGFSLLIRMRKTENYRR
jgi:hypothetical protein